MNIKVSVIIPVYNGRETIARCLESVMGQTLSDIEIIVVNDGSSDDTLSVLSTFNDERITVISQENAGQGFARNTGMRAARGEYISFVDADDTVEADMLEKMYGGALSSAADVVQCNITDIYSDGRRVTQLKSVDETVTVTDCGDYTDKYFTTCRHSYEVCNKLFKRVFLEQTGVKFRDTKKYFSEDLMFNLELIPHIKTISFISAAC